MASDSASQDGNKPISVLFVCLGNICRSPMAEAVFLETVGRLPGQESSDRASSLPIQIDKIDSCGTAAYHTGSSPDHRTMATLKHHKVQGYKHSARKLCEKDFEEFDWIFGMDADNVSDMKSVRKRVEARIRKAGGDTDSLAKVELWGDMGGVKGEEVIDPYYGGDEGFETAYKQMLRFGSGFLQRVATEREQRQKISESTL